MGVDYISLFFNPKKEGGGDLFVHVTILQVICAVWRFPLFPPF